MKTNVICIDFHTTKAAEMVFINDDDSFTIWINSRLSYDRQLDAYLHAIEHIENNDFDKSNVQTVEALRHKK